jgi:hypothetical protein
MRFETRGGLSFEIPDEWWQFAEMDTFTLRGGQVLSIPIAPR